MKPLHKYLRVFCSDQVQILLERVEARYDEEFDIPDSKWGFLYDKSIYMTRIERYCFDKTRISLREQRRREQFLIAIVERAMSPAKTEYEFRKSKGNMEDYEAMDYLMQRTSRHETHRA